MAIREERAEKRDPVHPRHYKSHPSGIECIDVIRHFGFNIGNVIKYLWRAGQKDLALTDLEKAHWYLVDEILNKAAGGADKECIKKRLVSSIMGTSD